MRLKTVDAAGCWNPGAETTVRDQNGSRAHRNHHPGVRIKQPEIPVPHT